MRQKKNKHLTFDDRVTIHIGIRNKLSLKEIAEMIGKDPTTISKEVKRNRQVAQEADLKVPVRCTLALSCKVTSLCDDMGRCTDHCKSCIQYRCTRICPSFAPFECKKVMRFPYVCTGCGRRAYCHLDKYSYTAPIAHAMHKENWKESRRGISLTSSDFRKLDELISPMAKKGQPLHHIYETAKGKIPCGESTLYNYFRKGYFTATQFDLPRMVKFKKRVKKETPKFVRASRVGRTYEDFLLLCDQYPDLPIMEMDTVHGLQDESKVLLTLFLRPTSLQLAYLLDSCTQSCVKQIFDQLEECLGTALFSEMFPVILTDNGPEFQDADVLEKSINGGQRNRVFYCNPMASWQKGRLEKNHEFLRYCCPKGTSMEYLTQEKVQLMVNHVNSTFRKSLGDCTPFQLAKQTYKKETLELLQLKEVPATEVILKPILLKS